MKKVTNTIKHEQHQPMIISSLQNKWNAELDAYKSLVASSMNVSNMKSEEVWVHPFKLIN